MSAAVKCQACNDTGMLPGSHDLDCGFCGVAADRIMFEAELLRIARSLSELDTLWRVYQMGKAAGAAQAVPAGWKAVPAKPDDNMAYFGARSVINGIEQRRNESWAKEVERVYTTMIHLAPEVP